MVEASFIYPPRGNFSAVAPSGDVNIYDSLEVTYDSSWSALNLTLFCLSGSTSSSYQYLNVRGNPILASGTYAFGSIDSVGFNIYQYPVSCHWKLTKYGNNGIGLDGEIFRLVSQEGTSTTYRMTSTSSDSTYATQTATGDFGSVSKSVSVMTASSSSSTSDSTSQSSSTGSSASRSSSTISSTSTPEPVAAGSGLSTGVKAGIGIGVALLVVVIAILCFMVFRLRKKAQRPPPEEYSALKPELAAHAPAPAQQEHKPPYSYDVNELEQTSRVELSAQPMRTRPSELE